MLIQFKKKIKRWTKCLLLITIFSGVVVPINSYASAESAILYAIFSWMKQTMMTRLQRISDAETAKITDQADTIFKQKTHWAEWPASLKELFVEQSVKYEQQSNTLSYKNAQDYLKYAQGNASGVDASTQPAKVMLNFNRDYGTVQNDAPNCPLNVPTPIGDSSHQCQPAQISFTNTLLTGVHPLPKYPDDALKTASGQQYIAEKKVNETRTALVQLALDQTTNDQTNQFIKYIQKQLQKLNIKQINNESAQAATRDILVLDQARTMIALRQYETSLMNERLLATLVAQGETSHVEQIHKLANQLH